VRWLNIIVLFATDFGIHVDHHIFELSHVNLSVSILVNLSDDGSYLCRHLLPNQPHSFLDFGIIDDTCILFIEHTESPFKFLVCEKSFSISGSS
jgi:hypothetical protein